MDEQPEPLKIRFHDLRHTAVRRMVTAGVPLTTIAGIVGWSKSTLAAMVARYSHPDLVEMRDAVKSISRISPEYPQFSPQSEEIDKAVVN